MNSHIPDIYQELGISVPDLGCVMLDTDTIPVTSLVEPGMISDLYYGSGWAQGAVGEVTAHVTLLYGLINVRRRHVDAVLDGFPSSVTITGITTFDQKDCDCLVATVDPTNLLDCHQRLSLLPHIDTFTWTPHITLAYLKKHIVIEPWIDMLEPLVGTTLRTHGLNYGDRIH